MNRRYAVHAWTHLTVKTPPREEVEGSFSFGYFDAAKQYAAKNLPGYEVIPHNHNTGRFEAVNQTEELGAVLWVYEIDRK